VVAGHVYAAVWGASGTGKSSLARAIASQLDASRAQIVYVSSSSASTFGLVNGLARTLRVPPMRSSLETSQLVTAALRGAPFRTVLWMDEADQVSPDILREIRLLAEADISSQQVLSVVLSGLPELRAILDTPALFPLKRRITLRYALSGLSRDELVPFLAHRFGAAAPRRFTRELADDLFERTEAIPALLDKVVRHALSRAGDAPITEENLLEAYDVCL
jgi:general secretion pathway protein A